MRQSLQDIRLTQEQKDRIAIVVGVLMVFCIGGYILLLLGRIQQPSTTTANLVTLPTTKSSQGSGAKIFLPVIAGGIPALPVENGSQLQGLPAETPTETPPNLWRITSIDPLSYSFGGFLHDLGAFQNVSTGETVKAFCANPGRPAPAIGDLFIRNDWNVLIPINDNQLPLKQRFIVVTP